MGNNHRNSIVLANSVDSVTIWGVFFCFKAFDLKISNDKAIFKSDKTDTSILINKIDKSNLINYLNTFFIIKKEKYYYKSTTEFSNLYMETDYPFIRIKIYKNNRVIYEKGIIIATHLIKNQNNYMVMCHSYRTYYYNKKFIDFYLLLKKITCSD